MEHQSEVDHMTKHSAVQFSLETHFDSRSKMEYVAVNECLHSWWDKERKCKQTTNPASVVFGLLEVSGIASAAHLLVVADESHILAVRRQVVICGVSFILDIWGRKTKIHLLLHLQTTHTRVVLLEAVWQQTYEVALVEELGGFSSQRVVQVDWAFWLHQVLMICAGNHTTVLSTRFLTFQHSRHCWLGYSRGTCCRFTGTFHKFLDRWPIFHSINEVYVMQNKVDVNDSANTVLLFCEKWENFFFMPS